MEKLGQWIGSLFAGLEAFFESVEQGYNDARKKKAEDGKPRWLDACHAYDL